MSVHNKILEEETSHDEIRALKGGLNIDEKDNLGRSNATGEIRLGIPDFLGSMQSSDPKASRIGAGCDFQKYNFSFSRIIYLFFNSLAMVNLRCQYTPQALLTEEQMVVGGADTVRGFPENDYLADYGYIVNLEFRTPAFLIPPILKVPFDKKGKRLMDAIQFVAFLDSGAGYLHDARTGERDHKNITGAGFGLRFDIYDHVHGLLDVGFPLSRGNSAPSDGSDCTANVAAQIEW